MISNKEIDVITNDPELKSVNDKLTEILTGSSNTVIKQPVFVPQYRPAHYDDLWQAETLCGYAGGNVAHNRQLGYLFYDGTVWRADDEKVHRLAQHLVNEQVRESETMLDQATKRCTNLGSIRKKKTGEAMTSADADALADYTAADEYFKYAKREGGSSKIKAALTELIPMVSKEFEAFDADGFILCCPDGDYDLRTGERHEHQRENYCTKLTAVSPSKADASAGELWDKTLRTLFCDDRELIEYVQLVAGMMLIGKAFEESLIIATGSGHGDKNGSNGKSSFFNVLAKVMGSYATSIDPSILLVDRTKGGNSYGPELATLRGMRLAVGAELPDGCRLNTSALKHIAATDRIRANPKYRDPMEFWPTHTPVIFTNYTPAVVAQDAGTWRRLNVIPFNAVIKGDGEIKNYADYLFEHAGPYILSWMIDGSVKAKAFEFKLEKPAAVMNAIQTYRQENDMVQRFLDECCVTGMEYRTPFGELHNAYKEFLKAEDIHGANKSMIAFRMALDDKELHVIRDRNSPHRTEHKIVVGVMLAE